MICRILGVIIRKHRALHQLEMVDGIHNGWVDTALVRAFVMHPAVVVLLQRGLLKEGTQYILILYLAHAQDTQRTVLRHGQNSLVHVIALAVKSGFCPMLHPVLGEGVIGFGAVHERVEEVLHVPEGHTDMFLC